MCGLIGISYGPDGPEAEEWTPSEFAQLMFPAIVERGPHAWGWMSYNPAEKSIYIRRQVGRSDTRKAIQQMDVDPNAKWWVGHVRWATTGSPQNMHNNHPIVHGKVVGVHNGKLSNYEAVLARTGRQHEDTEVDSEALFAAANKWGVKKGLAKVRGSATGVLVHAGNPGTLKIFRSSTLSPAGYPSKDLLLAWTPAGSLIFASTEEVLNQLGPRNTVPSKMLTNRLLTVRDGKITHRGSILSPTKTAQEPQIRPQKEWDGIRGMTDWFERERGRQRPLNQNERPTPPDGDWCGELRYYNGMLVKPGVYDLLIEDEVQEIDGMIV